MRIRNSSILLDILQRLLNASHDDLQANDWKLPNTVGHWVLRVQEKGFETFGTDFRFVLHDLKHFCLSPPESRAWDQDGNLLFTAVPYINSDLVVYSGTIDPDFVSYRLGTKLAAPFVGQIFIHPDTQWYNIASRIGMKRYFPKHSKQILDFFSALIARRLKEGKRVLLVSKKNVRTICIRGIQAGLEALGVRGVRVVTDHWEKADLADPKVIPLINYGIVGINLFQGYDAAYCLNGYYVNEQIVNSILQDIVAPEFVVPVRLGTTGSPLRRWADLREPCQQMDVLERLVPKALHHQEMDTVLQAVGRVRPYTSPREVITFQCAAHPHLTYTKEFENLEEARSYFGITGRRYMERDSNEAKIKAARQQGLTQRRAAEALGLSLRTVKRYWN